MLLTYWNTVAFQVLYARTSGWTPGDPAPELADRPVLDRWALSEAHRLATGVTEALEVFDTQRAGALLAAYVDDLSNWYVRRSRRRFWAGDPAALAHAARVPVRRHAADGAAHAVHHRAGVAGHVRADLAGRCRSRCTWPRGRGSTAASSTTTCARQMALTRRLVELGRAARAEAKVRTRQPLRRALVASSAWARLTEELRREVADELNVGALEPLSAAGADLVDFAAKGNFRALGKRFGKQTPVVAAAIAAADAAALAAALAADGRARGHGRRRGRRGARPTR